MDDLVNPHDLDGQALSLAPPLTVAPGRGSFRIKGLAIEGLHSYVAQNVPGGTARVFESIEDPVLREYVKQPFLAASRYDILPYLQTVVAAAAVTGMPASRFLAEQCSWQAARDVSGVYRLLLKVASPETVAQRLGLVWGRYFDFARIDVVAVTPGSVVLSVRQLPSFLLPWYRAGAVTAGNTVIALAGATDIKVAITPAQSDGQAAGHPLCRFEVRRTWR
jgi:hypothetical protein